MKTLSNRALVEKLNSSNPADNEIAMTYLYATLYKKVERFVLQNSGQKEEVKDLFQDGLLVFFKLVKQQKVDKDIKVEAYIFSTCRNLWFKKLQQKKKISARTIEDIDLAIEEVLSPKKNSADKTKLLNSILQELGEGCQTILLAFYYEQLSMDEIVQRMGLSSTQIAKNKKYKCLQRLKKMIFNSTYYKNKLR